MAEDTGRKGMLDIQLGNLPRRPGVYLFQDKQGTVIYVGKAQDLRQRVHSYFQQGAGASPRLQLLRRNISGLSTVVTDTEEEAFILESNLIKEHTPRFNIRFKDDKHYPYLCLTTGEDFPRLEVARRTAVKGYRYFGPYSDAGAVRETLRLIKKTFPLRSCRQALQAGQARGRPCLNYQINRCLAPCRGTITSEDYAAVVQQVSLFLEGRQRTLLRRIEREMRQAAAGLHFEQAAQLRDQLLSLNKMMERQKAISTDRRDRDVIALVSSNQMWAAGLFRVRGGKLLGVEHFTPSVSAEGEEADVMKEFLRHYYGGASYIPGELLLAPLPAEQEMVENWLRLQNNNKPVKLRRPRRGDKKALLELVQKNAFLYLQQLAELHKQGQSNLESLAGVLGLASPPGRIEGYDISHFAGRETVGAMVVFDGGKPWKEGYRRFIVHEAPPGDDYAALDEVLRRRLGNEALPLPDLILVDGGRGQLSTARAVLAGYGRPAPALVALAEKQEEIFLPDHISPLILPPVHPALKLLQRVRDEAHRFAITLSRKRQADHSLASGLTAVPGIGPARSKVLLQHFGGMAGLRAATAEELSAVPGINKKIAADLYEHLHNEQQSESGS